MTDPTTVSGNEQPASATNGTATTAQVMPAAAAPQEVSPAAAAPQVSPAATAQQMPGSVLQNGKGKGEKGKSSSNESMPMQKGKGKGEKGKSEGKGQGEREKVLEKVETLSQQVALLTYKVDQLLMRQCRCGVVATGNSAASSSSASVPTVSPVTPVAPVAPGQGQLVPYTPTQPAPGLGPPPPPPRTVELCKYRGRDWCEAVTILININNSNSTKECNHILDIFHNDFDQ